VCSDIFLHVFQPIVLLHSMIGIILSSVRLFVCLSVCDAVHCGSQGRRTGLKVVQACSYLSVQTLFLYDVSFSYKTHQKTSELFGDKKATHGLVYIVIIMHMAWAGA